jgi:hypothetical protein
MSKVFFHPFEVSVRKNELESFRILNVNQIEGLEQCWP